MRGITRKPAFWIAFAVVSALSGLFAWRYFPEALPLVIPVQVADLRVRNGRITLYKASQ